jgi:hypothetical protein
VARGIYRRASEELINLELAEFALRAPRATLCLTTALARHGLSDALIAAPDLALPRGTRAPVTSGPASWHMFDVATFELGRGTLPIDEGLTIGLYSPERSIVDAFRTRGREGYEIGYEALRRWLRTRGAEPARLLEMAQQLPRGLTPIRHALEALL